MTDSALFIAHGFAEHSPNVWTRDSVVIHKGLGFGHNSGRTEYRVHGVGPRHGGRMGAFEVTCPSQALTMAETLAKADDLIIDVVSWSLHRLRGEMGNPEIPGFSERQLDEFAQGARVLLSSMLTELARTGFKARGDS